MKTPERHQHIVETLKTLYPDGISSLQYQKDYELLFATRLSAQCTDERVNQVTPALFAVFLPWKPWQPPEPADVRAPPIHSCGFSAPKARDIVLASRMLLTVYDGKVPGTMDELLALPAGKPDQSR
ncbi:MAG: endonuclease III domain-containing protein [Evtepia sp.]